MPSIFNAIMATAAMHRTLKLTDTHSRIQHVVSFLKPRSERSSPDSEQEADCEGTSSNGLPSPFSRPWLLLLSHGTRGMLVVMVVQDRAVSCGLRVVQLWVWLLMELKLQ